MLFTKTKQYKCDRITEQADATSCVNDDKNVYSDAIPHKIDIAINDYIQIEPYQARIKVFATNIHIRRGCCCPHFFLYSKKICPLFVTVRIENRKSI